MSNNRIEMTDYYGDWVRFWNIQWKELVLPVILCAAISFLGWQLTEIMDFFKEFFEILPDIPALRFGLVIFMTILYVIGLAAYYFPPVVLTFGTVAYFVVLILALLLDLVYYWARVISYVITGEVID